MMHKNFIHKQRLQPKSFQQKSPQQYLTGYTLVELLVGLVLSAFIIGVALTYLVSSSRTFEAQNNDDLIQENARFALEILSRNIRLAGLNPNDELANSGLNVLFDADQCPSTLVEAGDGTTNTSNCSGDLMSGAPAANISDRFGIDYVTQSRRGCNNQTGLPNNGRVASVFWVADPEDDGVSSLYCQAYVVGDTFRGVGLPLIEGVDAMQVQYGVDTDGDQVVDLYQSYTNFAASAATNADIKAIRIALLLNSGIAATTERNIEDRESRTYTLLDAPPIEFDDGVLRQIFSTTVLVPNNFEQN